MELQAAVPVLRIFDEQLARAFYLAWLGFRLDWEHRFEPGAPLYMQVSRGAAVLHLTEHYGDCSPGGKVIIYIDDVTALHQELGERPNRNMRPGVEVTPWHTRVMDIIDRFGNRLSFNQRTR